jgi:ABC-type oligopeptide transport system ATPase subunit
VEILKVNNLSKVYGKGDTQIKALDNVSFSVEKGEFVAIVGPSGSGKSTLLHVLGGVDTPSAGQVLVDGTDICALDQTKLAIFRRRQIGRCSWMSAAWTKCDSRRSSPRSGSATESVTCPTSSPAGSSSVSPSGGR